MGFRPVVGFDTETYLFRPGYMPPDMVCATFWGGKDTLEIAKTYKTLAGDNAEIFAAGDEWGLIFNRFATDEIRAFMVELVIEDAVLVAHNLAFDALVLIKAGVFDHGMMMDLIESGALSCTKVREMLIAIADGNFAFDNRIHRVPHFSLVDCVEVYFGADTAAVLLEDKSSAKWNPETQTHDITGNPNSWRMRYAELEDVPLSDWPERAIEYAVEDALWARAVYMHQAQPRELPEGTLVHADGVVQDEWRQAQADFSLALVGAQGVRTDPTAVAMFGMEVDAAVAKVDELAFELGFLRVNKCKVCEGTGKIGDPPNLSDCRECRGDRNYIPKGARVPLEKTAKHTGRLQAWVSQLYGHQPPMTARSAKFPHGQVKTDADTILATGHDGMVAYAEGLGAKKIQSTYMPILWSGVAGTIHPRFNVLVRSGRTSCSEPNYQNPPRITGFRECHIAPDGMVFASIDYSTLELRTWAQTCLDMFGYSALAEAFKKDQDPHLSFGLDLLRMSTETDLSYDEGLKALKDANHPHHKAVKGQRQLAKIANFGFPGGLGAPAFVDYCKGYGTVITLDDAYFLKERWHANWPEATDFFEYIQLLCASATERDENGKERFRVVQPRSERLRGRCSYTSAANTMFQGPAADGMKLALWELTRAMYADESSPLYGVRIWNTVHDENIFVGPEETAHEWATEASRIMEEAMSIMTPDIPQIAEPALMRRWDKDAAPAYRDGRLIPFEDARS